jgi:hypothetical protein
MNNIGHYVVGSSCNLFNQILRKLQGQTLDSFKFSFFCKLNPNTQYCYITNIYILMFQHLLINLRVQSQLGYYNKNHEVHMTILCPES